MQNKIGGVPIDPKDETLELCDGIVFHFITAQGVLLQRCSIAKDEQSTTSSRQHHLTCSGRSHMICSRIVTIIARNNALMTTVFKTTCSTANIEYGWRWINMDQNRWIWMNMKWTSIKINMNEQVWKWTWTKVDEDGSKWMNMDEHGWR